MQLQVTTVNNIFNRADKDFMTLDEPEWNFIKGRLQKLPDESYYLYVNGERRQITHRVKDNDQITIIPAVAGGDDTKQILGIVAMVALAYFGQGWVMGTTWGAVDGSMTFMGMMSMAGIMVGGGMLINSMMPSPTTDKSGLADYTQSYGWNPQNTQQQGLSIPRFYGKNKIYGNVIAVHTETQPGDETKEILKALICLGMGPVEGVVGGKVYINDQLYTAFDGVNVEERRGLITQDAVSFFDETKPEYRVGILVENGNPQTYLTPDADYDELEIVIAFDRGLYYANDGGGISNHSVGLKIEVRESGGSWSTLAATTVTGNSTTGLYKTFRTDQTYTGGSAVTINRGTKYEVRVTKTTSDQASSRYGDRVKLSAIREVLKDGFIYPRKALLGIEALATDQLSGGLTLSCVQEGLIVNVYDGSSWNLEYSNNPAWVIWDILTQPVILGDGDVTPYSIVRYENLDPSRLDLVKFYELAQFCDTLVSDGEGGTEKRITFNGGFEEDTNVWEAVLKVCAVARCIPVFEGMQITLAIDKPGTAVQCFSDGNIVEGTFKETFLPAEDRVSEVEVSYVDAIKGFEKTVFSIYDPDSTAFYNKSTLNLYGITKESEAWRAGMFRLLQNRYLYSTVEFDADIDAIACTIGDAIFVQSSIPDWGEGGRIISATNDTVTLDKEVSLGSGTKKILVRTYDPVYEQEQIDERTVLSIDGYTATIDGTWTVIPSLHDVYAIGLTTEVSKKYRVINISKSTDQKMTISAIEYNEAVYGGDDSDPVIPLENYSEPGSMGTNIIKPPSVDSIRNIYPIDTIFNESTLTADIPLFNGFGWTDDSPSAGSVTTTAFVIYYKGITYNVAQFSSSYQFFYWTHDYSSGAALRSTNSLATVLSDGGWVVGMNISGTFYPRYGSPVIHGGLIQADTIGANHLQADSVDATKINVSNLAAISANLGTVTAGSVNASLVNTGTLLADVIQSPTLTDLYTNLPGSMTKEYDGSSYLSGGSQSSWYTSDKVTLNLENAIQEVIVVGKVYATCSGSLYFYVKSGSTIVWQSEIWGVGSANDDEIKSAKINPVAVGISINADFKVGVAILKPSTGYLGFDSLDVYFTDMVDKALEKA